MRLRVAACAGLLMLGVTAESRAQAPEFDVILMCQAGQELVGAVAGDMKRAVAAKVDVKPYADNATAIANWMRQFPALFPPGSEKGHDTKALPAIWSDRAGFEKAGANLVAAADKLSEVAKTGDKAAFAEQFEAMGKACGACHRNYRARSE